MFLALVPIYVIVGLLPIAVAFYEIVANVFGLLTHANLRIPAKTERMLRLLFVTPLFHPTIRHFKQRPTAIMAMSFRFGIVYSAPIAANQERP